VERWIAAPILPRATHRFADHADIAARLMRQHGGVWDPLEPYPDLGSAG
jgi:hypothetical protein